MPERLHICKICCTFAAETLNDSPTEQFLSDFWTFLVNMIQRAEIKELRQPAGGSYLHSQADKHHKKETVTRMDYRLDWYR